MARGARATGERRTRPTWGEAEPPAPPRKRTPKAAPAKTSKAAPKPAPKPARKPAAKAARKPVASRAKAGTSKAPAARKAAPAKARKAPARRAPAPRSRAAARARYVVVHDTEGPRIRLGICWFFVAMGAILVGPFTAAIVYGAAAAVAAAQTARCWRKRKGRPSEMMAAAGAVLVGAGAVFGAGGAGLGMLAAVVLAFVGAAGDTRSPNPRVADVGWTLQCALVPGVVAMSMVLLTRLDQGSAIALLLLVSAYETGDFLIGSGATSPYEGPAAGAAAIVVVTFIVSTLPIATLSFGEAWLFGGAVALLAPTGQLLASALLPSATSPASSLRRLDSLLVVAPVWAWGVGLVV